MSGSFHRRTRRILRLGTAIGVTHMGEQIVFGIEEYYMLHGLVGRWHGLFPENWADQASVLLITVVFAGVSLMFYALIRGGTTALIVIAPFGVLGVGE